jgi:N-acetylmuramoyl-L-alanine amidase
MRVRVLFSYAVLVMLIAPAAASASFAHVIAQGESLSSIAAADGLSVQQLAAANGISPDAQLIAGATIKIPPQGAIAGQATAGAPASDGNDRNDGYVGTTSTYVVRPGDTLSAIAARSGVSIASIAAANGLDPAGELVSGSVLSIPGVASASSATTSVSQPTVTSGGGPPYPTNEQVTGSQIAQIAAENGVPASLAEAIAWQESGFNNDLVSSADARGVMQIIPSTWNWIGQNLSPQPPLASASALDNVRGGVLLLHSLLAATGDRALAVAAYYQGLGSVQRLGVDSATQTYVNDVMVLTQRFGGG